MIAIKFGGSSLASADRIRGAVEIVRSELGRKPLVVVSALGDTTDRLLAAGEEALAGRVDPERIERPHRELVEQLGLRDVPIEPLLEQLAWLLRGVALIGELTGRTRDLLLSHGERLAARVVSAALASDGIPATAVDAWDAGLLTDSRHGGASPLPGIERRIDEALANREEVPVVTGFIARDERGDVTTLGRSGSDYTASILAAAVGADEVQIWTDVDGVMTCDPGLDDRAAGLPLLSFEEASELAYYGAAVLHPSTLVPAIRAGIPVRVLNTQKPADQGTLILDRGRRLDRIAKSVVYKEDVALITLASPRLTSSVELLALALARLAGRGIRIHTATTSEATVSLVTASGCDAELLEAARDDLAELGEVEIEKSKAIVCVVGEELAGAVGALEKIFGALSRSGIKAGMVSHSASEINVGLLVDEEEIEPTVRALHDLLLASGETDEPSISEQIAEHAAIHSGADADLPFAGYSDLVIK